VKLIRVLYMSNTRAGSSTLHWTLSSLGRNWVIKRAKAEGRDIIVFWSGKQLLKSFHMFPVLCLRTKHKEKCTRPEEKCKIRGPEMQIYELLYAVNRVTEPECFICHCLAIQSHLCTKYHIIGRGVTAFKQLQWARSELQVTLCF